MNGSPSRPRAPKPGISAPTVASTSVTADTASIRGEGSAPVGAVSALSLFGDPGHPSTIPAKKGSSSASIVGGSSVHAHSRAPSTIASVFDSSAGVGESTASPSTAHGWTKTLQAVRDASVQFSSALGALSQAADTLGHALEDASQQRPAGAAAEGISVSGSLHHLISNHLQILQSTVNSKLCVPLGEAIEGYASGLTARETHFRAELKRAKAALAEAEARNKAASRSRNRSLSEYRSILLDMTAQIDDINRLKYEFLCDLYSQGNAQAEALKTQLGAFVGAELEIFESIGRKGWSGGGLDAILSGDPFESSTPFTMLDRLMSDGDDGDTTIDADTTLGPGPSRGEGHDGDEDAGSPWNPPTAESSP